MDSLAPLTPSSGKNNSFSFDFNEQLLDSSPINPSNDSKSDSRRKHKRDGRSKHRRTSKERSSSSKKDHSRRSSSSTTYGNNKDSKDSKIDILKRIDGDLTSSRSPRKNPSPSESPSLANSTLRKLLDDDDLDFDDPSKPVVGSNKINERKSSSTAKPVQPVNEAKTKPAPSINIRKDERSNVTSDETKSIGKVKTAADEDWDASDNDDSGVDDDLLAGLDDVEDKENKQENDSKLSRRAALMREKGGLFRKDESKQPVKSSISNESKPLVESPPISNITTSKLSVSPTTSSTSPQPSVTPQPSTSLQEKTPKLRTIPWNRLPRAEKLRLMCTWLKVDKNDPNQKNLVAIAQEAVLSPVPSSWQYSPENQNFVNTVTNAIDVHPNLSQFQEKINETKGIKEPEPDKPIKLSKAERNQLGLDSDDSDVSASLQMASSDDDLPSPEIKIGQKRELPIRNNQSSTPKFRGSTPISKKLPSNSVPSHTYPSKIEKNSVSESKKLSKPSERKISPSNLNDRINTSKLVDKLADSEKVNSKLLEETNKQFQAEFNSILELKKTQIVELEEQIIRIKAEHKQEIHELENQLQVHANEAQDKQRVALKTADDRHRQNMSTQATEYNAKIESVIQNSIKEKAELTKRHQDEILSLKKQSGDSAFLRSLAQTVSSSASSIDSMQREMRDQRTEYENKLLSQLQIREKLVSEKEESFRKYQSEHDTLLTMFQNLQKESDMERKRLREAENSLNNLHQEMVSESSQWRDRLETEKSQLERQQKEFISEKSNWQSKYKRELEEITYQREQLASMRVEISNAKIISERELTNIEQDKKSFELEKKQHNQNVANFKRLKSEFSEDVSIFEKKMHALEEMGSQVHLISENIAKNQLEMQNQKKVFEEEKTIFEQEKEKLETSSINNAKMEKIIHQQKLDLEKERLDLLRMQKQSMEDKDQTFYLPKLHVYPQESFVTEEKQIDSNHDLTFEQTNQQSMYINKSLISNIEDPNISVSLGNQIITRKVERERLNNELLRFEYDSDQVKDFLQRESAFISKIQHQSVQSYSFSHSNLHTKSDTSENSTSPIDFIQE